jgi:Zn-dependent oligopeptidase
MDDYRCWEPKVLEKMTSHYKTKEPLPAALIQKVVEKYVCIVQLRLMLDILILHGRRYVNIATAQIAQVAFSKFDMKIHMDDEPTDYTKLWASITEEITGVVNDNPQPRFGECLSYHQWTFKG